ncbi:hypothetical protein OHA74_14390 [Streptomyces phaeochromogenes]|uniref:hypothetical protein n=1 Tax=Streptomyces phaeochromogenes TaxID=1923 RepID=UPI002E29ED84|nr:hypothetical protein [Streptomyces phaeochromogenes]
MITVVGHGDLSPDTPERVEAELAARLEHCPEQAAGLVRVGAGLPLSVGRAVHRWGRALILLLPAQGGVPALLSPPEREAAAEMIMLAGQVRLVPGVPAGRDARITADERLIASCRRVLAVWDGSPSDGRDATAHLVAFARAHSVPVEILWPAGATRTALPVPHTSPA